MNFSRNKYDQKDLNGYLSNIELYNIFVVKKFGIKNIGKLDEILKGHNKVAVILFDGMGQNIIRKK